MTTATPDIETRTIESKEFPGMFCAQIFCEEVSPQKDADGKPVRHFREMQFSSWHPSKREAIEELTNKCKMEGYKKV